MAHTCPDGNRTRLNRSGPVGTMEGVTYSCPRCGWTKDATTIYADAVRILNHPLVRAALR